MFISDHHKLIEDISLMAQYGTPWQNPIVDATCSEDISGTNPSVEVAMLAQYPYNDPVVNDPDQRIWKMWDNSPNAVVDDWQIVGLERWMPAEVVNNFYNTPIYGVVYLKKPVMLTRVTGQTLQTGLEPRTCKIYGSNIAVSLDNIDISKYVLIGSADNSQIIGDWGLTIDQDVGYFKWFIIELYVKAPPNILVSNMSWQGYQLDL